MRGIVADLVRHTPRHVQATGVGERPVELVACTPQVVADSDVVVVLADHDEIDWQLLEQNADRVLDTRNRLTGAGVDRL